jgi:hypothetical protein
MMRMKMTKPALIVLGSLVVIASCTQDTIMNPDSGLVVIQGYLYANDPVNDIRITATAAVDADTALAPPINDAKITLIKEGIRYELIPSAGDSGYYHYAGDDLIVEVGDNFKIEVDYFDKVAKAETVVPPKPAGVTMSNDTLKAVNLFELFQSGADMEKVRKSIVNTVKWESTSGNQHYILVENMEANPVQYERTGFRFRPRAFISRPTEADSMLVTSMTLTHLGKHRVKVFRINQEYADLYESRQQDSRDLNEPKTNVTDGLGVFTAFSYESAEFYFIQD